MSIKDIVKKTLPKGAISSISYIQKRLRQAKTAALPTLTERIFTELLVDDLGVARGDTIFIHSSVDRLSPEFPFYRILPLIQEIIGTRGTVLLPTYPQFPSYEFLIRREVFDVRKTPSYTGILTEFARRQRNAVRSLHPTKSVCAIGQYARELTGTHQLSPYPYDHVSPYYKIVEYDGKVIGLGVMTKNMSFVHCADDALKDKFPVRPYHESLFEAQCINYEGEAEVVRTYAHDMRKMNHNIPSFMKRYVPAEVCRDFSFKGRSFFYADAGKLLALMTGLAKKGFTIYPRSAYKERQL